LVLTLNCHDLGKMIWHQSGADPIMGTMLISQREIFTMNGAQWCDGVATKFF
jgi:hypothetical protein